MKKVLNLRSLAALRNQTLLQLVRRERKQVQAKANKKGDTREKKSKIGGDDSDSSSPRDLFSLVKDFAKPVIENLKKSNVAFSAGTVD